MQRREKPRTATDKIKSKKIPEDFPEFFCFFKHKIGYMKGGKGMQKNEQQKMKHDFSVEERKVLKASGVLDVEGFDETRIYAMLEGLAFTICGKNLKIINFSSETGDLRVEGEIDSVTYSSALSRKAGFFARILR